MEDKWNLQLFFGSLTALIGLAGAANAAVPVQPNRLPLVNSNADWTPALHLRATDLARSMPASEHPRFGSSNLTPQAVSQSGVELELSL